MDFFVKILKLTEPQFLTIFTLIFFTNEKNFFIYFKHTNAFFTDSSGN